MWGCEDRQREGSTLVNGRTANCGKARHTPKTVLSLIRFQKVSRNLPTNSRHLRQSNSLCWWSVCSNYPNFLAKSSALMCVGPSMLSRGEWIVPLKSRIEGTADMGFLFRLDQCDQNVTGICPLQSIHVTISHIRVGSVCVRD